MQRNQQPFLILILFLASLPIWAQNETVNGHSAKSRQAILKLNAPTSAILQQVKQLGDADDIRPLSSTLNLYVLHSKSENVTALVNTLKNHPSVVYAEPDFIVTPVVTPNDPDFSQQWSLFNTATPGADIGATNAWTISTGSTANVAAVVDSGIDYTHPDLAANVWSAPAAFTVNLSWGSLTCPAGSHGYNAITRTCTPLDDNGHGTHVSGTIGAIGNNALGVAGVNWTTRIMPLKFLDSTGSGAVSDAIDSIGFALQAKTTFGSSANVRVFSNSWGGSGFSQGLLDEINLANNANALFVVAAGNSSQNNDVSPIYPAAYNAPNIITVAATTNTDTLASFSNYGPATVHLGAPGVGILSTWPNGSYANLSGTSMATPHVSGAAMLVLSACNLSTSALKSTLLANVDPLASLAGITVTGGRLDVNKAIRSCSGGSSSAPFTIFGTGVSSPGVLAPDDAVDSHYTILSSADSGSPGPNAYVVISNVFPIGPWLSDGPNSKWIGPRADAGNGNAQGIYTYQTTFNLAGFNPSTAVLTGEFAADNSANILLNGVNVGINSAGFSTFTPFTISTGFVAGVNTLDFVVTNDPWTPNPTGLRVDISGTATPSSAPPPITVTVTPPGATLSASQSQTFAATVGGTTNQAVTWSISPSTLGSITASGAYLAPSSIASQQTVTVTAKSLADNTTTGSAIVTLNPSAGSTAAIVIFNTGEVSAGTLAADGAVDSHYTILASADPLYPGPNAFVVLSNVFPIGPWLSDGPNSKWIAPRSDAGNGNAQGNYTYRTTFNLIGLSPASAVLRGQFAADNTAIILLNGVAVGSTSPGFSSFTPFTISSGFIAGVNTLDFVVTNYPSTPNPTGLRVEVAGTATPTSTSGPIAVYNTGVNSPGVLAADASLDPHYTIIASADSAYPGPNAYVVLSNVFPIGPWLSDGPNSKWIAPRSDAGNGNAAGNYTYKTTFDLTGLNPATAVLSGQFAADNSAIILLNGAQVGSASPGFGSFTPFTISTGFISGVNTLDFVVNNAPFSGINPTGLRVEVSGTVSN
jgi:subtilisin family serine protease